MTREAVSAHQEGMRNGRRRTRKETFAKAERHELPNKFVVSEVVFTLLKHVALPAISKIADLPMRISGRVSHIGNQFARFGMTRDAGSA